MSACGSRTLSGLRGQMSSSPVPDCGAVGARSTLMPRDSRTWRVAGPIVATWTWPGSQRAQGGAALRGHGLERLDGGHTADHEPVVGPGAEGIEGDVEGVLVAGQFEVDQRQEHGLGPAAGGGRDEVTGAVRAAGDQDPGAAQGTRDGRPARAGCGCGRRCCRPMKRVDPPVQEAARSAMSAAPRASRTSASSIPSRVAPTSVRPSVAFLSRTLAVPSTAQTTASRCSMLPLR